MNCCDVGTVSIFLKLYTTIGAMGKLWTAAVDGQEGYVTRRILLFCSFRQEEFLLPPRTFVSHKLVWHNSPSAAPMSPLATQVHTGRTGALDAAKGHWGRAWEPRGTSPGAYSELAGPILKTSLLDTTPQNKKNEEDPPLTLASKQFADLISRFT